MAIMRGWCRNAASRGLLWRSLRRGLDFELDVAVYHVHEHGAALLEPPEKDFVGQRALDLVLHEAGEGTGTVVDVVPLLGEVVARRIRERNDDVPLRKLLDQLSRRL